MFTGLIKEVGLVAAMAPIEEGLELTIYAPQLAPHIQINDSVSVNGVCLTAIAVASDRFKVQCVHVTLEKSSLKKVRKGMRVNLELALGLQDRLGGHFVQGHVNGVGILKQIINTGQNYYLWVEVSPALAKYFIEEGSIALDGISLTIAALKGEQNQIAVSIIPHTWQHTNLSHKAIGDSLNIEVDMLAKYIEKLMPKHDLTPAQPEEVHGHH